MNKIKKKFWAIIEKIVRNSESFTFTLFLNLLFIIIPEVSSSRLTRIFLKEKKGTYQKAKKKKIQEPSTYFGKLLEVSSNIQSDSGFKFPSGGRVLKLVKNKE